MTAIERLEKEMLRITKMTGDPEGFHWEQDRLYERVLRLIAAGRLTGDDASAAADVCVRLSKTDATRWYA